MTYHHTLWPEAKKYILLQVHKSTEFSFFSVVEYKLRYELPYYKWQYCCKWSLKSTLAQNLNVAFHHHPWQREKDIKKLCSYNLKILYFASQPMTWHLLLHNIKGACIMMLMHTSTCLLSVTLCAFHNCRPWVLCQMHASLQTSLSICNIRI